MRSAICLSAGRGVALVRGGIIRRGSAAYLAETASLMGGGVWGYNPVWDDRSDFTQSRPLYGDMIPHLQWTPDHLSEALLAHDVHV